MYVFGRLENPEQKEYELYSPDTFFNYNGEVIGRLSVTAEIPEWEVLPIEFPKDIFSTANHTLGVYGYTEDRGYVIMEYVPETGEVKEIFQKDGANYNLFEQCEKGYLHSKLLLLRLNHPLLHKSNVHFVEKDILLRIAQKDCNSLHLFGLLLLLHPSLEYTP